MCNFYDCWLFGRHQMTILSFVYWGRCVYIYWIRFVARIYLWSWFSVLCYSGLIMRASTYSVDAWRLRTCGILSYSWQVLVAQNLKLLLCHRSNLHQHYHNVTAPKNLELHCILHSQKDYPMLPLLITELFWQHPTFWTCCQEMTVWNFLYF